MGFVSRDWLTVYRLFSLYSVTVVPKSLTIIDFSRVPNLTVTPFSAATMAHSYPIATLIPISGPRKTTFLPIRPIMPSDSEFAITLPFKARKVSQKLRAAIIKRTKDRWAWFSRAEDLDEERGTQLGTLGYLPWEIRQKIFGELFDRGYRQISWYPSENRRPRIFSTREMPQAWQLDEYPHSSKLWMIRTASASLMFEVEFAFITTMNLDFTSIEAIMYFLGCLTTCKNSMLRSITVPLIIDNEINAARKAWIDVCAGLPTGHNSIEFGLYLNSLKFWPISILEHIGIPLSWWTLSGNSLNKPNAAGLLEQIPAWNMRRKPLGMKDAPHQRGVVSWLLRSEVWRPGARNGSNGGQPLRKMARLKGNVSCPQNTVVGAWATHKVWTRDTDPAGRWHMYSSREWYGWGKEWVKHGVTGRICLLAL